MIIPGIIAARPLGGTGGETPSAYPYFIYAGGETSVVGRKLIVYDNNFNEMAGITPYQPPNGQAYRAAKVSPDGRFLAVGYVPSSGSRRVYIYDCPSFTLNRVLDNDDTDLDSRASICFNFSNDGYYFAVVCTISGVRSVKIYETTTWSVVKVLQSEDTAGSAGYVGVVWSKNDQYLILIKTSSLRIVFIDVATWSYVVAPNSALVLGSGTVYTCCFNKTFTRFYIGLSTSPRLRMFDCSQEGWPTISNPTVTIESITISEMMVNHDDTILAVLLQGSPYVKRFNVSADTFAPMDNVPTIPDGFSNSLRWSDEGKFLAAVKQSGTRPRTFIYDTNNSYNAITLPGEPLGPEFTGYVGEFYPTVKIRPTLKFKGVGGLNYNPSNGASSNYMPNPFGPNFGHNHAYSFEETSGGVLADSWGDKNGAIFNYPTSAPIVNYGVAGYSGNTIAVQSSNSSRLMEITNNVWLNLTRPSGAGCAIEFFVKAQFNPSTAPEGGNPNDILYNPLLLLSNDVFPSSDTQFWFQIFNAATNSSSAALGTNSGGFRAGCSWTVPGPGVVESTSVIVVDSLWHHIVLQIHPSGGGHKFQVYVDGVMAGESSITGFTQISSGTGTNPRLFFNLPGINWRYGSVLVDEVKIYNKLSFTPEQMANMYAARTS